MQDLEPKVQKFLIANRLLFGAVVMLAVIIGSTSGKSPRGAAGIALIDPYTTFDFSGITAMKPEAEAVAQEDDLNVPAAGGVTEEEPKEDAREEKPASEEASKEISESVNTSVQAVSTGAMYKQSNDNVVTTSTPATAAVTTSSNTITYTYTDSNGYYIDDNGVPVYNYVDNTPRYNLLEPVEEEPVILETPEPEEPADGEE